jgi:energy-coupling factor transporter ATP-binding protein EcfA2
VSFTVEPETVTGFLGPNGAGKSTTMRMIVGLTPPSCWDSSPWWSPSLSRRSRTWPGVALRDGDGSWDFGIAGFGDITILQLLGILGGVAYGMLLLNSAAAIVLSFALPTVVTAILFSWPKIAGAAPWVDPSTAQGPLQDHTASGSDWTHLAVNTLIWVVLPLAVGAWRVMRSEVKSA